MEVLLLLSLFTVMGGAALYAAGAIPTRPKPSGKLTAGVEDFGLDGNFFSAFTAQNERGGFGPRSFQSLIDKAGDLEVLARTLYGEARGEGRAGREAVASVILNRVRDRRWPSSAKAVCLQARQFSVWNVGDRNRVVALGVASGNRIFDECVAIAQAALGGRLADRTGGANHYHARSVDPSWNRAMAFQADIGAHKFWRA